MNNSKSPEQKGVVIPIFMPQAGNTMEEGTVVMWHTQPGDFIEKGQVVVEIETDKATFELEAENGGRLSRIVAEEGEIVPVKGPLAYIAENDEDVDVFIAFQKKNENYADINDAPAAPSTEEKAPVERGPKSEGSPAERTKVSPAARRLASESGIDLSTIKTGSGPGGRIVVSDLEDLSPKTVAGEIRRPMSDMRKAISKALLSSKQNIPHFYVRVTVDAGPMLLFYQEKKTEFKCSINDVIVMACARTVKEFPTFRGRLDGQDIVELPSANIGIAVGTEDGLIVPVLVDADKMSFQQLARETRRIVETARNGKIEGFGKGVFTITNLGMLGVEEFSAIINPPEAAILAVGAVRDEVVVRDGEMRPGKVMTMTLSSDHRIIDGVLAAEFMSRLKQLLEDPNGMTSNT